MIFCCVLSTLLAYLGGSVGYVAVSQPDERWIESTHSRIPIAYLVRTWFGSHVKLFVHCFYSLTGLALKYTITILYLIIITYYSLKATFTFLRFNLNFTET